MNRRSSLTKESISIMEVKKAVCSLNRNRATGHDMIPGDVLRSDACICFLHRLFCVCFETGKMPQKWSYGIINPIQKCATSDPREPGNYRGITITSAVYKAYCSILNSLIGLSRIIKSSTIKTVLGSNGAQWTIFQH